MEFYGKYFPHISREMNIKFYLKQTKSDASILICIINGINQTLKVATGHCVAEKFWDKKQQFVKSSMLGADELNELLIQLKLDVLKQIRTWQLEGKTDWLYIKQNLKKYLQRSVIPVDVDCDTSNDIVDVVKKFLLARSADYKPETARKYLILQTVWLQFESHRNAKVDISEISFTVMEEFRLYLLTVRNNRNDTIYKMLASLKCIIRWRIKNSFKADATCLELKQKVKTKNEIVTLSEKEIAQLRKLKLEDSLKAIRDSFLFMIFTVQRYSDMQQLKPEQITESCWRFTSIKAGKEIMVPFVGWNKVAFEIASQYDFNFPKYTQQHYNRELKAVCKEAGLNENIVLKRFQGSNTILIQNPKWKMISSHTARRTAVTLLLSKGVPPTVIMKLTGHSSIQTMMRYENTTSELLIKALKRI